MATKKAPKNATKRAAKTVVTKTAVKSKASSKKKAPIKPAKAVKKLVRKPVAKTTVAAKKSKPAKQVVKTQKTSSKPSAKLAVSHQSSKTAAKTPATVSTRAPQPLKTTTKPSALQLAKAAANRPLPPHAQKKQPPVFVPQNAKEQKALYKVGNHVVYPTHGVGKILAEETQMIGEIELRLLVINFEKDKMTLRVPMHRAAAAGLRPISGSDKIKEVYITLKSKAKTSRGMWSRRAQEYESKINSGNILLISEVVRDLHQNVDQSERSYSERMIYENALNRLVGEIAAAEGTDAKTAHDKLMKLLRAKIAAAAVKVAA